jgi:hypothetical protein
MGDRLQEPLRLGALLRAAGERVGLSNAVEAGRLWSGWAEVVGPAVAEHAEPSSLRQGVLRVRTDSPTWATEIGYLAEEIRQRANSWLGSEVVSEVRVWTGPGAIRRATGGGREPDPLPGKARATSPRGDEPDPQTAFERARGAWARGRAQGPSPGSSGGRENRKNAW